MWTSVCRMAHWPRLAALSQVLCTQALIAEWLHLLSITASAQGEGAVPGQGRAQAHRHTVARNNVPPSADTKVARRVLYRTISEFPSTHTEGFFIVAGNSNQANMRTVLPLFHQHVDCATRGVNTLDKVYTNMKAAYRAAPPAPPWLFRPLICYAYSCI